MKRTNWVIQAVLFYLFTLTIALLPSCLTPGTGKAIGRFLYNILHSRRSIALDNIRQALPFMKRHPAWSGEFETAEEIALATFENLGISIVEVCRLYHGKGDALISSMEVHGLDNFQHAKEKGNGVLCISGHCGNWELISLSFKRHLNENVWAIAKMQKNPYLNTIIEKMRMGYGNKVIYSKAALRPILSVIKSKGVIGMLTDQAVFEENGALIEFLGRKAWANKAPAVIARKTEAPIIPVFGYRKNSRHILTFHPEYKLCGDRTDEGTHQDIQALSRYLEEFVCAHPADWYWVHRRWKRAGQYVSDTITD
ncbi:MAG: lysophospholipid acyltransferase family protein [Desulfuromonadaceae bacterium]|nr:lysophospholipid acyltransferase family protein [Desulfuromonadaceae bacterium]MDD2848204.1 lysophospholipid acyltransferase family protein [Desulfuromonadaceae bacterium]MDD4130629.1 lysophospholipid acyltransferase family protein [Desulfuromonadaceae bacterium]